MDFGLIGLGNMGLALALRAKAQGHRVVAWNRAPEKREVAKAQGAEVVDTLAEVVAQLPPDQPRIIWLMVSAGTAFDELVLGEAGLAKLLQQGDIIIDGANSHFEKTKDRARRLAATGVHLIDCGISGGPAGALTGPALMVGGDQAPVQHCTALLTSIAAPEGYLYCGGSGAGHFVKTVHNAIEYGMMQSLAEGINLLSQSEFKVDLPAVVSMWNHGSIIEGRLLRYLEAALAKDPQLVSTPTQVGSLGTGKWAVEYAQQKGIPLPAITQAVWQRDQPATNATQLTMRVLQALRTEFGGHTSADRPV